MFKKIVSYLIIFSILYGDAAHCGNVWGRDSVSPVDDGESAPSTSIRRQTTENTERVRDQTEKTPLAPSRRWTISSSADVPPLSPNFSFESFAETSQGQSLPLWPQEPADENAEGSFLEEYADEIISQAKQGNDSSQEEVILISEEKALSPSRRSSGQGIQETNDIVTDAPSAELKENNASTNSITEEAPSSTSEELMVGTSSTHSIKRELDSSKEPEPPTNPNNNSATKTFEAKNLSEKTQTSRTESINNSDVEDVPVGASLALLEEDSSEEASTNGHSTESVDADVFSRKRSSLNPRSSYENEPESGKSLRSFFTGFQSDEKSRKCASLNPHMPSINQEALEQELQDFVVISRDLSDLSLDVFSDLSPEAQAFLRYVKKRIVDGELNWKQKLGIGGGLILGAGVAWPWMWIMFYNLLKLYGNHVGRVIHSPSPIEPDALESYFQDFNKYINAKTLGAFVGVPMGIFVASRTAQTLIDWAEDGIELFSLKKSKKHAWTLIGAKSSAYFLSIFSGLLPVYYLYRNIFYPGITGSFQNKKSQHYFTCTVSDIYLNISSNVTFSSSMTCPSDLLTPLENIHFLEIGAPFLFLSTALWYGHGLSKFITRWIDNYFFNQVRNSPQASSLEDIRQEYSAQFKHLSSIINSVNDSEINSIYNSIFNKKIHKYLGKNEEKFTINEVTQILKLLKGFRTEYNLPLEADDSEKWKKSWASKIGWAIPLISTMGRMMIFQFIMEHFLLRWWQSPNYGPSEGNTIFTCVLGYTLAHLSQGFMEKEAVKESIYEILGGKKAIHGKSHNALRMAIKVWDYMYGVFLTLPYLVIGLNAQDDFAFIFNYMGSSQQFTARLTLFVLSFGIADVFNNAIAFHHANFNLLNAFDSIKSYFSADLGYKRDKITRMIHQLRHLFKSLSPHVLSEIDTHINGDQEGIEHSKEDKTFAMNLLEGEERAPTSRSKFRESSNNDEMHLSENTLLSEQLDMNRPSLPSFMRERETAETLAGFVFISKLPPELQEFLSYIKVRIVNGTLNWKQKAGIIGGVLTGATVAWPMMLIIFEGTLSPYFRYISATASNKRIPAEQSMEDIKKFNIYFNFYTMMGVVGIPMAIDAASRTASILVDFTKDSTKTFSLTKSKKHHLVLLFGKGCVYSSVFVASFLPLYYLYDTLLDCDKLWREISISTKKNYSLYTTYDNFLNITIYINSPDFNNIKSCNITKADLYPENIPIFRTLAPFLFLDIFLQYGHQLSHHAEKWINSYFFTQMGKSGEFSFTETLRQKYLAQFKHLKQTMRDSSDEDITKVYNKIFKDDKINREELNNSTEKEDILKDAVHILKAFKDFQSQTAIALEIHQPRNWKKVWSERIGWAVPLIATFGRMIIFQYLIEQLFSIFDFSENPCGGPGERSVLVPIVSVILGGLLANVGQGFIEKDAVKQGVYEILGGKKSSEERSHPTLRTGIKVWDYIYGMFHTLPYLVIGRDASRLSNECEDDDPSYFSRIWMYPLLITFGLADAFNNAIAFHDSNLKVINTYDSLKATYGTASLEYKRDKLVRTIHQIRQLFKELDHPVLEKLDWLLNHDIGEPQQHNQQQRASDSLFADDEEGSI